MLAVLLSPLHLRMSNKWRCLCSYANVARQKESSSPLRMFQRLESVRSVGWGHQLGKEMEADSRTQSPGELWQTWLQDTKSSAIVKAALHTLINSHSHSLPSMEEDKCNVTHVKNHFYLKSKFKFCHLHGVRFMHSCL